MSFIDNAFGLPLSEQLKLLNQAVLDQRTARYLDGMKFRDDSMLLAKAESRSVTATTIMLYDIVITIDQEISYVWKTGWSYMKFLYLAVRYPVLVESVVWLVRSLDINASDQVCKIGTYLFVWATLVFLVPLQVIIFMRTVAIWGRKKLIVLSLSVLLFATDVVILVTLSRLMHIFTFELHPDLKPLFGCDASLLHLSPSSSLPAWCSVMVFDTSIFVLTLAKAFKTHRFGRDNLITVLIRDGFGYYAVMLVLAILNLIFYCALPPERLGLSNSFSPFTHASFSIVGSRLILNLRGAAKSQDMTGTTLGDNAGVVKLVDISGGSDETGLYSSPEFGRTAIDSPHFSTRDNNPGGYTTEA